MRNLKCLVAQDKAGQTDGWGFSGQCDRRGRRTENLRYQQEMVKSTFHNISATGFNFLQRNLALAINNFNGIPSDSEISFL